MIWNQFTIVIVTKDRPQNLLECFNHIARNSLKPAQIIIVDGSKPKNKAEQLTIALICKSLKIKDIYVYSQKNLATCRNLGIKKVTTKYFCFIDDDYFIPLNWIRRVRDIYNSKPEIDILVGPLLPRFTNNYWNRIWLDVNKNQLLTESRVGFVPGANTCYKTSFTKKNRVLFNPKFSHAAEDWGITYETNKANGYIYQTKTLTALHNFRTDLRSFFKQWFYYGVGIHEYHILYLIKRNANKYERFVYAVKMLLSRFPIKRNTKRLSLVPGYSLMNLSFALGYIYSITKYK